MFKQAFRLAFVALIWKQYKALIVSTLLLFFYIFLVGNIHDDYLAHLKLQDSTASTGMSFILKWGAYAGGLVLYFIFHWWRGRFREPDEQIGESKSSPRKNPKPMVSIEDDPSAEIRERDNLRSRADFLMEDKD